MSTVKGAGLWKLESTQRCAKQDLRKVLKHTSAIGQTLRTPPRNFRHDKTSFLSAGMLEGGSSPRVSDEDSEPFPPNLSRLWLIRNRGKSGSNKRDSLSRSPQDGRSFRALMILRSEDCTIALPFFLLLRPSRSIQVSDNILESVRAFDMQVTWWQTRFCFFLCSASLEPWFQQPRQPNTHMSHSLKSEHPP